MMFQVQALSSKRFQRGFHRFNLHLPTVGVPEAAAGAGFALRGFPLPPPLSPPAPPAEGSLTVSVVTGLPMTRGLHSSTFRLNVSTFCGIRWVHDYPPVC